MLDVHFCAVGAGAELVGMLLQNVPAWYDVVLLSAPVVTVEVEPEVLFARPVKLVLVD